MRLLISILSLFTLFVLLSAENCSGPGGNYKVESRETQISDTYRRIENEFIKDELSVEDLNAFEKRVVQKIRDIADYINIYADTSLSVQFRAQANQMIQDNFLEKKDVEIFYNNLKLIEDTLNTTLYYSKKSQSFKTEISSIEITNHFLKKLDLSYSGEIRFTQRIEVMNSSNAFDRDTFQFQIKFIAVKTVKHFGNEKNVVWEVYLTEVKLLPEI